MKLLIVILVIMLMLARKLLKSGSGKASASGKLGTLCSTCVHVYRVKGGNGKELIYCNYTSDLRSINFEVCECTGYRSNNIVPLTRVIGFAPVEGLSREEAFPAVAIRIERD